MGHRRRRDHVMRWTAADIRWAASCGRTAGKPIGRCVCVCVRSPASPCCHDNVARSPIQQSTAARVIGVRKRLAAKVVEGTASPPPSPTLCFLTDHRSSLQHSLVSLPHSTFFPLLQGRKFFARPLFFFCIGKRIMWGRSTEARDEEDVKLGVIWNI